jgi:uncharacterized membrane protein YcaP (DUF421 family)
MSELLTSPQAIALIVLRTVVVYSFVLIGLRWGGKREVGQMAPFDFALILLIANAVQNAMVGPDSSLVGGLVAAGVLILVNSVLGLFAARSRRVERLLRGRARVLIFRGHVQEGNLEAEKMSHADLLQALRENGLGSVDECRLAVLEVDGTVSVVARREEPGGGPVDIDGLDPWC